MISQEQILEVQRNEALRQLSAVELERDHWKREAARSRRKMNAAYEERARFEREVEELNRRLRP